MAKNNAIVIGINQYDFLQPLNYAKQDAQLMQKFLRNEAGFDRIFFFSDDSPPTSKGNSTRPNRNNLLRVLREMFENPFMGAGDNFWFFFSGHGMRHADHDYLMPNDGDPQDIENTAIKITDITKRLFRCGADNVVLILDACRNQGSRSGEGIGKQTAEQARQTGVISIFSCTPNQLSYEIDALQQGAFTYTLLKGLGSQGRCATVEQLHHYLTEQVPQLNRQYGKPSQIPYTIVEPITKSHLILLPRYATKADIETLKNEAYSVQAGQNWKLAEQLWIRVLDATSSADRDAERALQRIRKRKKSLPVTIGGAIVTTLALVGSGIYLQLQPKVPSCSSTEALCKIFPQVGNGKEDVWRDEQDRRSNPTKPPTRNFVSNDKDCGGSSSPVLKLQYEFPNENQRHSGWAVTWDKDFDISKFSTLEFRIKRVFGNGNIEVGLEDRNGNGNEDKYPAVASSDWKPMQIPLSEFGNKVEKSKIKNINIGFLSQNGSGTICIDKIQLR